LAKQKKEKNVINSGELSDIELKPTPDFYSSVTRNPSPGRVDGGMNLADPIFQIAKIVEFNFKFTYGTGTQKHRVRHNLGYRPFPKGNYRIKSLNKGRIFGDVPDTALVFGHVWIDDITNNEIVIGYNLGGGSGEDSMSGKLYLFTARTI
jgi:hypothetical protein